MLKIENLEVYYEKIAALKGVSLEIAKGEIVGIIGANGAGKTTLINAISGVVRSSGKVFVEGAQVLGMPAYKIARSGIVQIPEGRKVFAKQTVQENMELGAFNEPNTKKLHKMLDEMFELFPILKERKRQFAGTLSGGEQQMLAIARGLMAKPSLLMFDEPSMGLSPVMVEKVFKIIKEINNKGITILLVEQNAKKSLEISQRAYVLETGKIVLQGPGAELLNNEQVKKAYLGK